MNHQVQALLLGCEKFFFTSSVDEILTISCDPADLLVLDLEVNHIDVTHVVGLACRQDHPDHALAQNFLFALRENLNKLLSFYNSSYNDSLACQFSCTALS